MSGNPGRADRVSKREGAFPRTPSASGSVRAFPIGTSALAELRERIDDLDERLVRLLAERLGFWLFSY